MAIRVLHMGLGPIGLAVVKQVASRKGFKSVGAVDIDPAKLGKDLGEVAGLDKKLKAIDSRIARALQNDSRRKQDAALLKRLSVDRIEIEIRRIDIERQAARLLTAEERRNARQQSLNALLERWEATPLAEAHEILKDSIERIDVHDDRLEVSLY